MWFFDYLEKIKNFDAQAFSYARAENFATVLVYEKINFAASTPKTDKPSFTLRKPVVSLPNKQNNAWKLPSRSHPTQSLSKLKRVMNTLLSDSTDAVISQKICSYLQSNSIEAKEYQELVAMMVDVGIYQKCFAYTYGRALYFLLKTIDSTQLNLTSVMKNKIDENFLKILDTGNQDLCVHTCQAAVRFLNACNLKQCETVNILEKTLTKNVLFVACGKKILAPDVWAIMNKKICKLPLSSRARAFLN